MATTKITRTFGTPTDLNKWTWSAWIKRGKLGTAQVMFEGESTSYTFIQFNSTDNLYFGNYDGSFNGRIISHRKFRDTSAWYHLVAVWDSDNATPGDRMRFYVNGVEETSLDTDTIPGSGQACFMASGNTCWIGVHLSTNDYFDGEMSHVQFVDGLALAPTEFGEVDSTSGIWKIKTGCYATPGNNGFCLKMENSSNMDLDSSSNAHTFSTTGTLTATKDNPDNNFCTMNPLANFYTQATYQNSNTQITFNSAESYGVGTFGMSASKWYWEVKLVTGTSSTYDIFTGIATRESDATNEELGESLYDVGYYANGGGYRNNNSTTSYGDSYASPDVIGVALDLTNNKLYFSKNGVWQNSGVPTSGATGTGAISITAPASQTLTSRDGTGIYHPAWGKWAGGNAVMQSNFGNGYFGTTGAGATNADDAGIGVFKYDVPAGYYALCTKNIKAYGG